MRALLLGLGLAALAAPAIAGVDANLVALHAKAEGCISSHAVEVDRASNSLTEAVDFLVNDLCAPEISAVQKYRQNTRTIATMKGFTAAGYADIYDGDAKLNAMLKKQQASLRTTYEKASVDPNTGEIRFPEGDEASALYALADTPVDSTAPAEFRATAARAILEARHARLTSQNSK
jgi:hypothetical protein